MSERYYSQPAPYHGVLQLAIPKDWLSTGMSPNAVKPVSPLENMMAFILLLGLTVHVGSHKNNNDDHSGGLGWGAHFIAVQLRSMVRDSDDDEKLAKWRDFSRSAARLTLLVPFVTYLCWVKNRGQSGVQDMQQRVRTVLLGYELPSEPPSRPRHHGLHNAAKNVLSAELQDQA